MIWCKKTINRKNILKWQPGYHTGNEDMNTEHILEMMRHRGKRLQFKQGTYLLFTGHRVYV